MSGLVALVLNVILPEEGPVNDSSDDDFVEVARDLEAHPHGEKEVSDVSL